MADACSGQCCEGASCSAPLERASPLTHLCDLNATNAASQYGNMTFDMKVDFLITSSNTESTSEVTSAK